MTALTEYESRVAAYLNEGMTTYQAQREAIWDVYGDEIRAEQKRKRLAALQDCDDCCDEEALT